MISIEKIKTLEQKVQRAVETVTSLRKENTTLHTENTRLQKRLAEYESRISELEILIQSFKEDQTEIEMGISNALAQLDRLEDEISSPGDASVIGSEERSDQSTTSSEKPAEDPNITVESETIPSASGTVSETGNEDTTEQSAESVQNTEEDEEPQDEDIDESPANGDVLDIF
jgi:FtsZ-binding cell division protein ZapB